MLEKNIREQIIDLIHRQVVPAVGCTEPMAVALCTARATELLGQKPERISAQLSANILKNAMGVGIPGTGMIGLPIAISLGALIGKSSYQLEVIKDLTPESLEEGKKYVSENHIDIKLKEGISEKLYIEITCEAGEKRATAIISHTHTNFIYEEQNGKVLMDKQVSAKSEEKTDNKDIELNLKMVWDFATTTPLEEIDFILEAKRYNMRAAKEALKGNYGHCLGKTMDRPLSRGLFGNSIYSHIISKTASACDARMGGAMVPVMSNSGSGNQGICATNPVVVFAKENENTPEELVRALTLSHLTAIYIKQNLGALSALCGCIVASTGSSCGITYLMGGNFNNICYAVKNMIANLTGMICDGAKPSCSLKISSGVSTAVLSAMLSMEGRHVTEAEGIIDKDVDRSIKNLTSLGKDAMCATDDMVLNIMTNKNGC
ncbi:serine dehydratase subunit alpha family protein [Prevotella corporis]|jgi:L-cysteine desulfidase|uniref:L-cysteine desulfidase family protein n=1 Tax=Prevotella corporis TaxID=28128 RepID=UPI00040F5C03|nr:L-serine ammonia-lyase, iron-sulfur-dependent, subunit alpha [Prevotella corporis]MDQ7735820.1 serine dehydratase subunit alpha family protein [Prevotella corporis]